MATTKREKLFTEFPPVSTEQWEEVIKADLKGADYERKLVWKTPEGFNVRPYYRAENLAGLKFLGSEAGVFPYVRGTRAHNRWKIHQTVIVNCPKEANAVALKILNAGVDSIEFQIVPETFSAEDLNTLLKDMTSKGSFCSENGAKCFEKIADLVRKTKTYKGIRVITVSGEIFSNAGSTIVEALAFSLAAGHDYLVRLMDMGFTIEEAAKKIRFSQAITSNYFMEIAKLRAGRMLWANIVKAYNPAKNCPCKMFTHAVTSTWNQTAYDPYVNMLRGTTEAMSASIAGVHSLEVTPFNKAYEDPNEFSMRIARNVELLLKHESHFDQVVDPAGGSYYIENLTDSIANEAWKLFREIEEKGGYTAAYESGFIVERVKASAAAKDKNIATRREILLGANQYPNFTEVAGKELTEAAVTRPVSEGNTLAPYRGSMAFEAMRLHVDRSGKAPKAFMLTCGSLAMARARAQFSCNFFACAGIKVIDNTFFKSIEEGVKAALESKAEIVVVCASDDDYAEAAPKVKELLGDKAILVVAGAPACMPELEAQGIKNFINVKSNVLETLKFYLKEMGI